MKSSNRSRVRTLAACGLGLCFLLCFCWPFSQVCIITVWFVPFVLCNLNTYVQSLTMILQLLYCAYQLLNQGIDTGGI